MGDDRHTDSSSRLSELGRRLDEARGAERKGRPQGSQRGAALGFGFRIAVDLVAAVIVGFGIGYFLDWLLGTSPWLLLLFIPLGVAAGILNVIRSATEEERRRRQQDTPDDPSE